MWKRQLNKYTYETIWPKQLLTALNPHPFWHIAQSKSIKKKSIIFLISPNTEIKKRISYENFMQ